MYDVMVIGGGPSGMTACLYAKRMGKSVLLLEGNNYGGQITSSLHIENYPALKSVSGAVFADSLLDQILSIGVVTEFENVNGINKKGKIYELVAGGKKFEGKTVIIASGCSHRRLDVADKEFPLIKKGISYCAVCDGAFYQGEDVAVIGGGNTALEEALYLSSLCRKVYVIHRRDCFKGSAQVAAKLCNLNNVEIIYSSIVSALEGENELAGIILTDVLTGEKRLIKAKGMFVAIGQTPQTAFCKNVVKTNEDGFIIADENCGTSEKGIFAAGDCRVKQLRQLVTAVSDGAVAAVNACRYIDEII
jgi:thioredoxin reductase (NADPH)